MGAASHGGALKAALISRQSDWNRSKREEEMLTVVSALAAVAVLLLWLAAAS